MIGTRSITSGVLAGTGDSTDPLAGVDRDALNLRYRPSTLAQWAKVGAITSVDQPVSGYGFQETSGTTIADLFGTKPLTISGAAALGVAIAGAATTGIGGSATNTNQFALNATVANINATDVAFLLYVVRQTPTAGHQVAFHGASAGNAIEGVGGSSVIRLRNGTPNANGALAHGGVLRPLFGLCRKGVVNALWSDIEEVSIADNASMAGATFQVQFRISSSITTSTVFNFGARWEGAGASSFGNLASARVKVKSLLQTLGHTVTGY